MPLASPIRRQAAAVLAALGLLAPVADLHAAPVQWTAAAGGNDHWYEYVTTGSIFTGVDFNTARSAALSSTHQGLQGYLATVTSAAEQAFIESAGFPFLYGFGGTSSAWLGGSDAAVEGTWRWLDGPEAGQAMGYSNWFPGQPVAAPGYEDYDLLVLRIGNSVQGAAPVFGWVNWSPAERTLGYLVEYGTAGGGGTTDPNPVPEPPVLLLVAAALGLAAWRRGRA